uniref:Uncharacterized protein n=1 Tax=Anguilla anguilla TaxID=7936 RepID=A0A0E9VCX4_ANGAN
MSLFRETFCQLNFDNGRLQQE